MKKIAKLQISLFQSDSYRAMLAKYGAPGALLIVRLQVMQQEGPLPDFSDERRLLILATELATDVATLAEMLQTLRQWAEPTEKPAAAADAEPARQQPSPVNSPKPPTPPDHNPSLPPDHRPIPPDCANLPITIRGYSQQSDRDSPPKEKAAGTPIALNALTIVPIVRL